MNSASSTENSPLAGWQWDAGANDYVQAAPLPDEAAEIAGQPVGELTGADISRLFPENSFRSNVAAILKAGGGLARLESLKVKEDDPGFIAAMEVAYRRLLAGENAVFLKYLSNRDLADFLIVSAFAGPWAKSILAEINQKKAAKTVSQAEPAKGGDHGE